MTQKSIHVNKKPLLQVGSPKSSLYQLKKTFSITPDSPLATERVVKFSKIEIVPIDLQKMLEQHKSKETPVTSPKNQALWPPKVRKEEYKIGSYDLFQSVRKNVSKVDDLELDKLEFIHAQNSSGKIKHGKSLVSLLTTSRNGLHAIIDLADPTMQEKEKENNLKRSVQQKISILANGRSVSDAIVDLNIKEEVSKLPTINKVKNTKENSPKKLVNHIFKNKQGHTYSKSFKEKFDTNRSDLKLSNSTRLVPNQQKRTVLQNTETIIRSTRVVLVK